jgi:hypothetical protein
MFINLARFCVSSVTSCRLRTWVVAAALVGVGQASAQFASRADDMPPAQVEAVADRLATLRSELPSMPTSRLDELHDVLKQSQNKIGQTLERFPAGTSPGSERVYDVIGVTLEAVHDEYHRRGAACPDRRENPNAVASAGLRLPGPDLQADNGMLYYSPAALAAARDAILAAPERYPGRNARCVRSLVEWNDLFRSYAASNYVPRAMTGMQGWKNIAHQFDPTISGEASTARLQTDTDELNRQSALRQQQTEEMRRQRLENESRRSGGY